jgi:hypothetical protein
MDETDRIEGRHVRRRTVGLLIGISIAAKIGMNYLFEGKKLALYLITVGYHIVSYIVAGLIIGSM